MLQLTIPWPPSINHYWKRSANGRLHISASGEDFRQQVVGAVWSRVARHTLPVFPPGTRVSVRMDCAPPDRRVRDLDNLTKSTFDALTHAGLWADDQQVDALTLDRRREAIGGMEPGTVRLTISTIEPIPETP